ncbi:site-specific integrase [Methylophaga thiooxydans]|uniref:Site-specific recombinase, phage integrase family protein n=1 Tax=Methylophaga thiooxydans DMS010 TaxID=637616 RepID=C0N425_9GAMM|nr:site-specific integrase [Methylophaga thiooxydans]EEF80503.1 site-specific recombinase, phage integrase family protein [Methylophaga thiooxydans DMS010]
MEEKTREAYLSQAKNFIKSRLGTTNPHVQELHKALIDHALDDNPPGYGSWNKKRRALEVYYLERGIIDEAKFIKATKFPDGALYKKPGSSIKKVSNDDCNALLKGCMSKRVPDLSLAGAIAVVRITGCRPSEMMSIQLLPDNGIYIEGSKQTEDGKRGMDRHLYLDDEVFKVFSVALKQMKKELDKLKPHQTEMNAVGMLQKRLDGLNKKLFPRRKKHITFKSFRHQLGSDLKSSSHGRIYSAAILGHQSVDSINGYGDSRSGKGRMLPCPSRATMNNVRIRTVKNADFKQVLISNYGRKPDKGRVPANTKAKIGGSTA